MVKFRKKISIWFFDLHGVTSNDGFQTFIPEGASYISYIWVISLWGLSSITIWSPLSILRSKVEAGSAT